MPTPPVPVEEKMLFNMRTFMHEDFQKFFVHMLNLGAWARDLGCRATALCACAPRWS